MFVSIITLDHSFDAILDVRTQGEWNAGHVSLDIFCHSLFCDLNCFGHVSRMVLYQIMISYFVLFNTVSVCTKFIRYHLQHIRFQMQPLLII